MSYAAEHAAALTMLAAKGASVTFNTGTAGTHAPDTGLFTAPTTSTVTGSAIAVAPNRTEQDAYRLAGISADRALTLLFAPTTYGSLPTLGATVTWNGDAMTVKGITPVAPDGTAIIARVWCAR